MKQHLFVVPFPTVEATDFDTVHAITADLNEMGLYQLPYDEDVYVRVIGDPQQPGFFLTYGPMGMEGLWKCMITNTKTGAATTFPQDTPAQAAAVEWSGGLLRDLLIALLATKNVEKSTRANKLRKLGIGKRDPFDYTTTISVPKSLDDDTDHPPIGAAKAPHLRRGHIRRQHYGAGNEQIKKIWIAPVFVNADPGFVSTRKAYRIPLTATPAAR